MPCTFVCSHSSHAAPASNADGAFEGDTCAVCLDPMTEEGELVTLSCGHRFHSMCAVDVFRRGDTRCPVCRDNPHATEAYYDDNDEVDDFFEALGDRIESRVNFRTGLRHAMRNRIDKPTQRMKATLRKWKTTRRDAREDMKEKNRVVAVLEDVVTAKIAAFEKKLWATFDKHHKHKVEQAKTANAAYRRATTQVRNSEVRLAKKYGYIPYRRSRRSRVRRRRNRRREAEDDEDDEDNEDNEDMWVEGGEGDDE